MTAQMLGRRIRCWDVGQQLSSESRDSISTLRAELLSTWQATSRDRQLQGQRQGAESLSFKLKFNFYCNQVASSWFRVKRTFTAANPGVHCIRRLW
jgi:hypothetical protein